MDWNKGKETFQWIIYNQEEENKNKNETGGDQLSSHSLPVPTKEIVEVSIKRQCSITVYLSYFGLNLHSN